MGAGAGSEGGAVGNSSEQQPGRGRKQDAVASPHFPLTTINITQDQVDVNFLAEGLYNRIEFPSAIGKPVR